MDYKELITSIFEVVLIPLLSLLTAYFIKWIKIKAEELKQKHSQDQYYKYIGMLEDIVTNCVLCTQQTYVEQLKKEGSFDLDAQKHALQMTYDAVIKQLSTDAAMVLEETIGDLQDYIIKQIETKVYENKNKGESI